MTTKKKPSSTGTIIKELQGLGPIGGIGLLGAPPPAEAAIPGVSAKNQNLPVTFELPGSQTNLPVPEGATKNAKGETTTTYGNLVAAYYKLDPEQLKWAQEQMYHGGMLSINEVTGHPNTATLDQWKQVAMDSAQGMGAFTSLLNMGAAVGNYNTVTRTLTADAKSAMTKVANASTGTYTETDPNQIKQALSAAYAAIGEGTPSPQFADSFVNAFHQGEASAVTSELTTQKADQTAALGQLQGEANAAVSSNPSEMNAIAAQSGPVFAVAKPMPNLDAEAMAQAKASDPAQYYATQSSYLYGILDKMMHEGSPSFQTAPTAPSQTAPGGAVVGTPMIPAGG